MHSERECAGFCLHTQLFHHDAVEKTKLSLNRLTLEPQLEVKMSKYQMSLFVKLVANKLKGLIECPLPSSTGQNSCRFVS